MIEALKFFGFSCMGFIVFLRYEEFGDFPYVILVAFVVYYFVSRIVIVSRYLFFKLLK